MELYEWIIVSLISVWWCFSVIYQITAVRRQRAAYKKGWKKIRKQIKKRNKYWKQKSKK